MNVRKEIFPACGLYCGVCGVYRATIDNNTRLKEKFAAAYGVTAEQISCAGCNSDNVFVYCRSCPVKSCAAEKKLQSCSQCNDYPCGHIENFPVPEGKKNILKAIPRMREIGIERWVAEEEGKYVCAQCGAKLFRGARRCSACKTDFAGD